MRFRAMTDIKGDRLYVNLGASQVRKRLKGHGFGVRKVFSDDKNRAVIIRTDYTSTAKCVPQASFLPC